jgi:hypothetical protein
MEPDVGLAYFGPQTFSDSFESGKPSPRWGCDLGGCPWQAAPSVSIAPTAGNVAAGAGSNYAFQSPDPQALDLNQSVGCQAFTAHFAALGTFAFDYFVNTAGPVGLQGGNVLEVRVATDSVMYDAELGEYLPLSRQWETVVSQYGRANARFQKVLPPGFYEFEFCYNRQRTFNLVDPDFVQVDNVETCVGTSCFRDVPLPAPCTAGQGVTLLPSLNSVPTLLFAVTGSGPNGRSSPYTLIINAALLDLFIQGLNPADSIESVLRQHIDGVRTEILVDARTCDSDTRKYVRLQMTDVELVDFILATFELNRVFIYVYLAIEAGWTVEKTQEMVQAFINFYTPWKAKVAQGIAQCLAGGQCPP